VRGLFHVWLDRAPCAAPVPAYLSAFSRRRKERGRAREVCSFFPDVAVCDHLCARRLGFEAQAGLGEDLSMHSGRYWPRCFAVRGCSAGVITWTSGGQGPAQAVKRWTVPSGVIVSA
jgi:hypothetical protein